jgi:hypothetical protein
MQLTTSMAAPDLRTLLQDTHRDLLLLRRRQYALEAFLQEVEKTSREETFDIHNELRWLQILDFRDKNVIDLASWAKAIYSKGGLFGVMRAHHLAAFPSGRTWGLDMPEHRQEGADEQHAETRRRLFGQAVGPKLKPDDVQVLHDSFAKTFEPVVLDRHENRAHVYERGGSGTARMLDVTETRELFDHAHRMLNGLSLLAFGSTTGDANMNLTSVEGDAEDLVDELMLPRYARIRMVQAGVERATVYDALHARQHDPGGKPAFNSAKAVRRVLVDLGLATAGSI